jgi:lysophospholipase L1-like esterase
MKILRHALLLCAIIAQLHFSSASGQNTSQPDSMTTSNLSDQKTQEEKSLELKLKNDWANLDRFREDNLRLGEPSPNEARVVFMGNSITEGWKDLCPEFFSGRPYINRGISGQTTPQMLVRFRPDVINLKPKVVVILAGTNDIAGNTGPSTLEMIEDNIESMVDLAETNGIKVVICSVLPAIDYWWNPGVEPAEKIVALNGWLRKYAASKKITYVDFYSNMADNKNGLKSDYSEDGVHPNKKGYQVMEPLIDEAIARALKQN